MSDARRRPLDDAETIPRMPAWVTAFRAETLEDVAFLSGTAVCHLQLVLEREDVPQALVRERLALLAAEACVGFSGRPERAARLRDILNFLRPGDLPGPAGEISQSWRRAVERPVSIKALRRALPEFDADRLASWLGSGKGTSVAWAAAVLEAVLTDAPRAEGPALILADAALAKAHGWDHLWPLLALRLKRADLRKRGDDLRRACHRALTASAIDAVHLASDLAHRATHLKAVVPKLRAKGAAEAVEMFLTRDALTPSALPLPNRAARRLCDRLVALGALRELTGRDTFRLYGV